MNFYRNRSSSIKTPNLDFIITQYKNILENEKRVGGRKLNEIRKIDVEVGLLPRTHGSGVFQRGETQGLTTCTLGSPGDAQILEGIEGESKKSYFHHYNFHQKDNMQQALNLDSFAHLAG